MMRRPRSDEGEIDGGGLRIARIVVPEDGDRAAGPGRIRNDGPDIRPTPICEPCMRVAQFELSKGIAPSKKYRQWGTDGRKMRRASRPTRHDFDIEGAS